MTNSTHETRGLYHIPVVVIGGGQAGLSASYFLKQRRVPHIVFEQHSPGYAWREQRWDSFCLVTPNWQCTLPGFSYSGEYGGTDPDGFMTKPELLAYLAAYVRFLAPPLQSGVRVERVSARAQGGFLVETSAGPYTTDHVIVAAGNYHSPKVPALSAAISPDIQQVHASRYKNPDSLPDGAVLVVGTGQSGCQIAEDLHLAGRQVHLCLGSAPRVARRYRGRDVVAWLADMGHYDLPVHKHPLKEGVRAKANHYVTGRDGGRDIDLRVFARQGMALHGRLSDVRGDVLHFADDLAKNLDGADATSESIKRGIDDYIAKNGLTAPEEAPYVPCWAPELPAAELDYKDAGIRSVVWAMGYRTDFGFIDVPVFDARGYPAHSRGVTTHAGLYFLGLPWLYTWGSGRFSGVARDAGFVVEHLAESAAAIATGASERGGVDAQRS